MLRTRIGLDSVDLISQLSEILLFCNQRKYYPHIFRKSDQRYAVLRLQTRVENLLKCIPHQVQLVLGSLVLNIDKEYNVFVLMLECITHLVEVP